MNLLKKKKKKVDFGEFNYKKKVGFRKKIV